MFYFSAFQQQKAIFVKKTIVFLYYFLTLYFLFFTAKDIYIYIYIYIHTVLAPPSNERFDYFSNLHEYKS